MRKTKKVGKQKKFGKQKHKYKSKRLGRGKESMVTALLEKKLNDVHLRTYGQEFVDPGNPSLVSNITRNLTKASMTQPIKENITRDQTSKLLASKFRQLTSGQSAAQSSNIVNTIMSNIPKHSYKNTTTRAIILRKNKQLLAEIRRDFSNMKDRSRLVSTAKFATSIVSVEGTRRGSYPLPYIEEDKLPELIERLKSFLEEQNKIRHHLDEHLYNEDDIFEEEKYDEPISKLKELLQSLFSDDKWDLYKPEVLVIVSDITPVFD